MNFVSKSSNFLLPAWLTKVKEECEKEALEEQRYEIKLFEDEGRKMVWLICLLLDVNKRGVPGHACKMVERYVFHQMELSRNFARGSEELRNFLHSFESQLVLIVTTCVNLSAKKFLSKPHLSINVICTRLQDIGFEHTDEEMSAMEFNILKSFKVTLPLWTSVDVARLIAFAIGMSEPLLEQVELIMNLAELRRNRINHEARTKASLSTSPSRKYVNKTVRSLHLAGGVVLALMQYQNMHDMRRELELVKLTCAPYPCLKCLSLIVYKNVMQTIFIAPQSKKRTHDE